MHFRRYEAPIKLIIAITVVIALAMAAEPDRRPVGGFSEERVICTTNPTPEDRDALSVFNATRPMIEGQIGRQLGNATLVSYRTQVVAGLRFLLRIRSAPSAPEFIHASVWRRLTGDVVLGKVETGKTESDTLN